MAKRVMLKRTADAVKTSENDKDHYLTAARLAVRTSDQSLEEAVEALANARDKCGATQREMAKAVGKSQSWVRRVLKWFDEGCKEGGPFDADHEQSSSRLAANQTEQDGSDADSDLEEAEEAAPQPDKPRHGNKPSKRRNVDHSPWTEEN